MKPDEKKAVTTLTKQASTLFNDSTTVTISDDAELKAASSMLASVKATTKELTANKKAITDPLNKALKETRALFKQPEEQLASAEKAIKGAILAYHEVQDAEAKTEIEKIENRTKPGKGNYSVQTAMVRLSDVDQPETNLGGAQIKEGPRKVRITDVHALVAAAPGWLEDPRVMEAIRMAITPPTLTGTISLPGTEIYRDKLVAGIAG